MPPPDQTQNVDPASILRPHEALEQLLEGNRRWVAGRLAHPDRSLERREELAVAQWPFATVFCCIDSRVTPEIVFDCGIGDLAVISTGAHVLDDGVVLGSLEFGPDQLRTPLVMVMGHQRCGAIATAAEALEHDAEAPGRIASVVDVLRPAYAAAVAEGGEDLPERMARAQTRLTVQAIMRAPLIAHPVEQGKVKVVGAYYSLDTRAVSILD